MRALIILLSLFAFGCTSTKVVVVTTTVVTKKGVTETDQDIEYPSLSGMGIMDVIEKAIGDEKEKPQ